jgi:hypothetical protein
VPAKLSVVFCEPIRGWKSAVAIVDFPVALSERGPESRPDCPFPAKLHLCHMSLPSLFNYLLHFEVLLDKFITVTSASAC